MSAAYTITGKVATSVLSLATGTYTTAQSVTITCATPGATIRYTTDGSTPTSITGLVYSSPVPMSATMTINVIAYLAAWDDSTVASAAYTMNLPPPDFRMTFSQPAPWVAGARRNFTISLAPGRGSGSDSRKC